MIDLTPLEVRKKKGDFRRAMRGYDPALVDDFLDLVADRLEELVRENLALHERVLRQDEQVRDYRDRERALTEALVSAQEMREEVRRQAVREAELATQSAQQHAEQLRAKVQEEVRQLRASAEQETSHLLSSIQQERQREEEALRHLRARQQEFLGSYRAFLEEELQELGVVERAAGAAQRAANTRQKRPAVAEREPEEPPRSRRAAHAVTGDLEEQDIAEESALVAGEDPAAIMALDEEQFEPEPFVEDESAVVAEAFIAEAAIPTEAVTDVPDETDVSGSGAENRLYDGIAADEGGDGVPGPIGLGGLEPEPWSSTPEWTIPDLDVVGSVTAGEDMDLDQEEDEETEILLRNAAAAGYRLEDDEPEDELLLEEAVPEEDTKPDAATDDGGWLPTLLEDDK